jgi:nitrite reductase/ring-hydroxylating ferredoxin subunit
MASFLCSMNGSQFDPATGEVLKGVVSQPLLRYAAEERDGGIYVTVQP